MTVLIFIDYVAIGYDADGHPATARHSTNVDSAQAYSAEVEKSVRELFNQDHPGGKILSAGWSRAYDVEVGK